MTMLGDALLLLGFLAFMPAVLLFAAEILWGLRRPLLTPPGDAPAFTVLIPAHDEAGVIAPCIRC